MAEKKNNTNNKLTEEETLSLMSIYLEEFTFRDHLLWSQTFKFFYATLIVILLPNISGMFSLDIAAIPSLAFRVTGLIMAVAFLYASLGYVKRLEASTKTYGNIISMLPKQYQRVPLRTVKFGRLFQGRMSTIIVVLLFFSLVILDTLLIIFRL